MKVDEGLIKQYPFLLFIFFSWRCRPVGYSGEGVWVKVRWHWIGDRSKGRVVSACNAASEIGRRYMRASFLYRYHRRCKPVGYSGEGVWVKVRWHWIGKRSKCRVVTA